MVESRRRLMCSSQDVDDASQDPLSQRIARNSKTCCRSNAKILVLCISVWSKGIEVIQSSEVGSTASTNRRSCICHICHLCRLCRLYHREKMVTVFLHCQSTPGSARGEGPSRLRCSQARRLVDLSRPVCAVERPGDFLYRALRVKAPSYLNQEHLKR